jgi:hypothetical protein
MPTLPPRSGCESHREVQWRLIDELGDASYAEFTASLALIKLRATHSFLQEAWILWQTLAIDEVAAFLAAELDDHQLDGTWAEQIEPYITRASEHFSMARGFNLCWLAVRDVASAYLRFPGARDRLPYKLRSSFESKVTRAQGEGWVLRDFARHIRCPESAVAAVFSTVVTKLKDDYLRLTPSLDHIRV